MNQEETVWDTQTRVIRIEEKLDKLIDFVIPAIRDVSKYLAEAKQTANKGKPPRKQPKKKYTGLSREKNPLGNKRIIPPMQDGCGRILNFS